MGRVRGFARLGRASARLAGLFLVVVVTAARARAFSGTIRYDGELGPVGAPRPLCLCVFTDPQLTNGIGCQLYRRNNVGYSFQFGDRDYYLIAFLDVHINERVDPDEPFEIFLDHGTSPGDPVNGRSTRSDVDFLFGDENLPGAPTETPTLEPSATATITESPTPTVTATPGDTPTADATPVDTATASPTPAAVGDCDGDGQVSVSELVRAVGIALDSLPLSNCGSADRDGDGHVRIEELVAALDAALDG